MPATAASEGLGGRLRQIRLEILGTEGLDELERRTGIPARTWMNYETGVTISGLELLMFIEITSASPRWLLHGDGPRYRHGRRRN